MTPEDFGKEIGRLKDEFKELFDKYGPTIAGKTAVSYFKKNFQNEAWGRVKWTEVQRRTPGTAAFRARVRPHSFPRSRGFHVMPMVLSRGSSGSSPRAICRIWGSSSNRLSSRMSSGSRPSSDRVFTSVKR